MREIDELRARQEALEVANETLHEAFRQTDGDAHEALTVAKANVKLMTALRATQLEHGRVLGALVADVTELKTDVAELKTDVAELKTDVAELKTDVAELKTDVAELKTDVAELKTGMATLTAGMSEVLRRLPSDA